LARGARPSTIDVFVRLDPFSVDTLIDMLARLGIRVRLVVGSSKRPARVA
jgi:hypothetical protein